MKFILLFEINFSTYGNANNRLNPYFYRIDINFPHILSRCSYMYASYFHRCIGHERNYHKHNHLSLKKNDNISNN